LSPVFNQEDLFLEKQSPRVGLLKSFL